VKSTRKIDIFTDGASSPKSEHQRYGAGTVCLFTGFRDEPFVVEVGSGCSPGTNNLAELWAIDNGLAVVEDRLSLYRVAESSVRIRVLTDSKYCIQVLKKTFSPPYDSLSDRDRYVFQIQSRVVPGTRFIWVPGHSEFQWNQRADAIAVFCKHAQKVWRAEYPIRSNPPELPDS